MKRMLVVAVVLAFAPAAMATFIVEAAGGVNVSHNSSVNAADSTAVGMNPDSNSLMGGAGTDPITDPDLYDFWYTPGVDADNEVIAAGTMLGDVRVDAPNTFVPETLLASGMAGGGTGLYNVYITWPESTNVSSLGSRITVQNDGADVYLDPITMNSTENGPGAKGNNAWLKIASGISLTAGNMYHVTVAANSTAYVSQRVAGVMWEAVPEPTTFALLSIGGLALMRRKR